MQIGIIGAGSVGKALAHAFNNSGHEVSIGVRDPEADRHGTLRAGGATIVSVAEAATHTIVVLATPWDQTIDLVRDLDLAGKTIIDTTNPIAFGPGGMRVIATETPSAAEDIAKAAPGASVFKTLNQVGAQVMGAAQGAGVRPLMFAAGDSATRKKEVLSLVADIGFDARDAGVLSAAHHLESLALLWIGQAISGPMGRNFALAAVPWREQQLG